MKLRWLPALLILAASPLPAAEPRDLPVLEAFPDARIVEFRDEQISERRYPLGAVRRIAGRLRMDAEVVAGGQLTALTYQLPSSHGGIEAFTRSRRQLIAAGGQLLFWCEGRDCGSSSLWANEIFGQSRLYGPENLQAYLLLRPAGESESLLALYAITRGNGRAYLHAEQLLPERPLGELLPTPATLLAQLKESGRLDFPALTGEPSEQWVGLLARMLQKDITLRVVLSGATVDGWYTALVASGVRASRLEADRSEAPGLHLELLR